MGLLSCPVTPPPDPLDLTEEWGGQARDQVQVTEGVEGKREGRGGALLNQGPKAHPLPQPLLSPPTLVASLPLWLSPRGLQHARKELSRPGGRLHTRAPQPGV